MLTGRAMAIAMRWRRMSTFIACKIVLNLLHLLAVLAMAGCLYALWREARGIPSRAAI